MRLVALVTLHFYVFKSYYFQTRVRFFFKPAVSIILAKREASNSRGSMYGDRPLRRVENKCDCILKFFIKEHEKRMIRH